MVKGSLTLSFSFYSNQHCEDFWWSTFADIVVAVVIINIPGDKHSMMIMIFTLKKMMTMTLLAEHHHNSTKVLRENNLIAKINEYVYF